MTASGGPAAQMRDERLANGLRLITLVDRTTPVAAVNIWYHVGSKDERPGRTGFAHLFEHLMFQGSENVTKAEHLSLLESIGGSANATTWLDRTNYFAVVPAEWVELVLWMEADRLRTLLVGLDQENLDNQRDVVKNEKRSSYDNQPYGGAYIELFEMAYPKGHPYHHPTIGSMDDLDAASLQDVRDFFSTWYAPNNAVLTVVGDIDEAVVRGAVERWFGPIAANPALPAHPDLTLAAPLATSRKTIRDRVPDPRLHVAFRLPPLSDPSLPAAEVACQILASGRGSRLHRRLVRDEQVAQDVSLDVLAFAGGASLAVGAATLRPGASAEQLEKSYGEELARLAAEGPTATEMERAVALIESEEMAKLGDPEELADEIGGYATLLNDPGRALREVEIYRAVTAEQVRDAARAFAPEHRVTLWYEPDGEASA
ncbi:MAG: insulinase family protein [Chloroflexi bacterium]|nr:MAG: insulinase family protein [Chloroflexota bacterium]